MDILGRTHDLEGNLRFLVQSLREATMNLAGVRAIVFQNLVSGYVAQIKII